MAKVSNVMSLQLILIVNYSHSQLDDTLVDDAGRVRERIAGPLPRSTAELAHAEQIVRTTVSASDIGLDWERLTWEIRVNSNITTERLFYYYISTIISLFTPGIGLKGRLSEWVGGVNIITNNNYYYNLVISVTVSVMTKMQRKLQPAQKKKRELEKWNICLQWMKARWRWRRRMRKSLIT